MKARVKSKPLTPQTHPPNPGNAPPTTERHVTPDSDPGRLPPTPPSPRVPPGREKAHADFLEARWRAARQPRCQNCVFGVRPKGKWWRLILLQFPNLLACLNHPDGRGEMVETISNRVCRNFRCRYHPPVRLDVPVSPGPGVRVIALTRGKHVLVDAEDYDRLMKHKWIAFCSGGKWYAGCNEHGKRLLMHRAIMKAPQGLVVDHIDGNGLNNCKSNLRICTQAQNLCNSRPRCKTTHFKGVCYDKERGKYMAYVSVGGRTKIIGRYADLVEAAHVRDLHAVQLYGEFAYLNFPAEWSKERIQEVYAQGQTLREKLKARSDKRQVTRDKKAGRRKSRPTKGGKKAKGKRKKVNG